MAEDKNNQSWEENFHKINWGRGRNSHMLNNKMFYEKDLVTGSPESGFMLKVLTFSAAGRNTMYLEGKELTSGN